MSKVEDLTGRKFERLTVLSQAEPYFGPNGDKHIMWVCRCDCGKIKTIRGSELRKHRTLSCGCLGIERRAAKNTTHGHSKDRVYHCYLSMIDRCYDSNSKQYDNYGGRGIRVCDEWRGDNGVNCFIEWAYTNGYADNLSLDRIDVNGNYEPSNCRWVTVTTQNNNKRDNVYIEINGETHTMKEWSRIVGIKYTTLKHRIHNGWDKKEAVLTPTDMRFSH